MIPHPASEESVFRAASQLRGAVRGVYLDEACQNDPALRERVEARLAVESLGNLGGADSADLRVPTPEGQQSKAVTIRLDFADEVDDGIGQSLGPYKLLERIGEGGCGVVYVAEQSVPVRRRVALKVIKLGMDTKAVVARFEAERQALAMMDHPNIAKVLDAGTTETGRPFFVMELVRGVPITDFCDQGQLTTSHRLKLFVKVCQAIQHAHQKGIIHRDIKPSNILVTLHDGVAVPKVIDFGIAKATEGRLTDSTVYTQLHQFIGTPAYMSPEQAEMSGLDIDTRSDIYSLGVLLYELLTGKTPFDPKELMANGIDAMRRTVREKEPVRPSTRFSTLAADELTATAKRRSTESSRLPHLLKGDLDWIVMKCLEKDRSRRYDTANGLGADIERYLGNEPVLARPPSAAYKFQKAFRRHKLAFLGGAAVAMAVLFGLISTAVALHEARRARDLAIEAQTNEKTQRREAQKKQREAEVARQQTALERERADDEAKKAVASELRSRRLLYASDINLAQQALQRNNLGRARRLLDRHRPIPGGEDLRGWEWRYLWQLTQSGAMATLTNRVVRGSDLSLSPDGNRLAVGWGDGRVELWDVPGRRLIQVVAEAGRSQWPKVAFSPRSNLLAYSARTNAVILRDLGAGSEITVGPSAGEGTWVAHDLSFSADGSRLLIEAGSTSENRDQLWVINAASGATQYVQSAPLNILPFFGAARLSPDLQRLYFSLADFLRSTAQLVCVELSTGKEVWRSPLQKDSGLSAMAVSPDGRWVASGSGFGDSGIRIWDAATGQSLARLEGHSGWVCKLAVSADGRRLISAATDQSIRFWDTATWSEVKVFRGHREEVQAMALSSSAHLLASASKDGELLLWREEAEGPSASYQLLPEKVGILGALPMIGSRAIFFNESGPPEVRDLKNGASVRASKEFTSPAQFLAWAGSNLLCRWNGSNQMVVEAWDALGFSRRGTVILENSKRPVNVALNSAREQVAWLDPDKPNGILLSSWGGSHRRAELTNEMPYLIPIAFSEDGGYLFTLGFRADILRVWDMETAKSIVSFSAPPQEPINPNAAVFAAQGRVLVVSLGAPLSGHHEVVFFDLIHPENPPRRVPGGGSIGAMAASPDGALVAATTDTGLVRLFDPLKAQLIEDLHGHLNAAVGLAFSSDGRRLISSLGGHEAVKLWDVATHQELLTFEGIGSLLSRAAWSGDGDVILAGTPWQTWRAPSWEEIAETEAANPPRPASP